MLGQVEEFHVLCLNDIHCVHILCFLYSSIGWQFGDFHSLAIVNKTTLNIGIQRALYIRNFRLIFVKDKGLVVFLCM